MFVGLLVPLMVPRAPHKALNAVLLFLVLPVVAFVLLVGGVFGLEHVETPLWGGLLVTLVLSFVGIVVSLPLGILLALGRRSTMPVVKLVCVIFIETVRGVPLVTVLFMASVMLPLFLPAGVTFDKLLCVPWSAWRCLRRPIWRRSSAAVCRRCRRASMKARSRSGSATGR